MTGGRVEIEDPDDDDRRRGRARPRSARTDQPEGKLVLDLDGDIGTLQPWLNRVHATSDLAAAGRITGHVETDESPAGLAFDRTLNATLSMLSRGDKSLAKDVRVAIDLIGQRAEVREMLGPCLAASSGPRAERRWSG